MTTTPDEPAVVSLEQLGLDPNSPEPEVGDPGTAWHPHPDKAEARDADGLLVDLDDAAVAEHAAKPEAAEQPDAGEPAAAEDSATTPDGVV